MKVLAVHTGTVGDLPFRDRAVRSAIAKRPVAGPVLATALGLAGDEQGDTVKHGGPDKAICVFPAEHYAHYAALLGRPLAQPAFGENLTTEGLLEHELCVGDQLLIGAARCEISLPRNPCFKLGAQHGPKQLVLWMERSGLTGFYLRVLEPGEIAAGAPITLAERPHPHATLAEANRAMHHDRRDWPAIERLLAVPELAASWRRTFEKRLAAGEVESPERRRYGTAA